MVKGGKKQELIEKKRNSLKDLKELLMASNKL
jgi:hypothetical protein